MASNSWMSLNGSATEGATVSLSPNETLRAGRKPGSDSVTRKVQKKVLPLSNADPVPASIPWSGKSVTQSGQPSILDS